MYLKGNQLKEPDISRYAGAPYTVGIAESENASKEIKVSTNPVIHELLISSSAEARFEIFDMRGSRIASYELKKGHNTFSISDYKSGTYLIKMMGQEAQKIIIIN